LKPDLYVVDHKRPKNVDGRVECQKITLLAEISEIRDKLESFKKGGGDGRDRSRRYNWTYLPKSAIL
jgi:hypothetical protein